jgi:hypothetical protein
MGANGPIPISRLAGRGQLPAVQGFISIAGFSPPARFEVPGPPLNHTLPPAGIGPQWAPGAGGDTPGGGGAFTGETAPVETAWFQDGYVVTPSKIHNPGTVSARGPRRSQ